MVLVSVGRRPYTQHLGLEAAGVIIDTKGRVKIDEHFRTSVPNIFAIGDAVQGLLVLANYFHSGSVAPLHPPTHCRSHVGAQIRGRRDRRG